MISTERANFGYKAPSDTCYSFAMNKRERESVCVSKYTESDLDFSHLILLHCNNAEFFVLSSIRN